MNKKKRDERHARLDEAERRYTPKYLMNYFIREADGTVVVDRDRAFDLKDETQASDFYWILQSYYRPEYRTMLNSTMYFEDCGDVVCAGCYDLVSKKKISKRPLVSAMYQTPYICTEKAFQEFKRAMMRCETPR